MNQKGKPQRLFAVEFTGKELEVAGLLSKLSGVKTLPVDDYQRVRLPDAKPRAKFAYENHGDGTITLREVKKMSKERFPPGSLKEYVTPDRNKELLEIARGCSLEALE